jgi:hypothetical protein
MLGITTPDAIAFGMMVLAALAAWRGSTQGTVERAKGPPTQALSVAGATIADTASMQALTQAVIGLTDTIRASSQKIEEGRKFHTDDLLQQMLEELRSGRRR